MDDDVYVNVPELMNVLQSYDSQNSHLYLGRLSIAHKLEVCSKYVMLQTVRKLLVTCALNVLSCD